MRRHGPVIAYCTDSEDFPSIFVCVSVNAKRDKQLIELLCMSRHFGPKTFRHHQTDAEVSGQSSNRYTAL